MIIAKRFAIVAAAALLATVSAVEVSAADTSIAAAAFSGRDVRLLGTLAPIGSFEYKAASSYTALAAYRDKVYSLLADDKISVDLAQAAQNNADRVRELLDDALRACAQDNHTGKCKGDEARASKFLAQAKAALARLNR